ncbi:MAG: hypothetical protein R2751_17040 [Bacteroidales bacterium]
MHLLLLCILSSTGIFVIFKLISARQIPSFPVILLNYLVASLLGFLLYDGPIRLSDLMEKGWLPIGTGIGILFILLFFVLGRSSRQAGMSVSTVASKMSVVFPIAFSLLIDPADRITGIKAAAIVLALAGVALTVYKPDPEREESAARGRHPSLLLPLILFVGMGLVDSLVKFAQHRYVDPDDTALFSAVLFACALFSGLLFLPFSGKSLPAFGRGSTWLAGMGLGVVNFGSIYFLVRSLNHTLPSGRTMDSSLVFGINNTAIVAGSVLIGLVAFREKLHAGNWTGIALSLLALLLFSLRL